MKKLSDVTLVAVTGINLQQTRKALEYSCRDLSFGEVLFLSPRRPWGMPSWMRWQSIDPMNDIQEYNRFILYDLWKYIHTDFALINHYDGFVIHPELWDDRFMEYDYIGAPWPVQEGHPERIDEHGEFCRVGNGVSLRSRRLLEFMDRHQIPFESYKGTYSEDILLCVKHRYRLMEEGLSFAPLELASVFCHENDIKERDPALETFMFHDWSGSNRRCPKFFFAKLWDQTVKT